MEDFIETGISDGLYDPYSDGYMDMSDDFGSGLGEADGSILDDEFSPSAYTFPSFEEMSEDSLNDDVNDRIEDADYCDHTIKNSDAHNISFGGKYSDEEIQKLKDDVDKARYEMRCREREVCDWESKVSLNDTKEHRAKGDYENALRHLNDAKSKYNDAASRFNDALYRYNSAK